MKRLDLLRAVDPPHFATGALAGIAADAIETRVDRDSTARNIVSISPPAGLALVGYVASRDAWE